MMIVIPLYKYYREDGGVSVSPIKPIVNYTECFRIIADDGMILTQDNNNYFHCIDTYCVDEWIEIKDENIQEDYYGILNSRQNQN